LSPYGNFSHIDNYFLTIKVTSNNPRIPMLIAQSFSPFSAQDGRQTCRPAMNFSVTKMQEENKIAQLVF
jgi:hypothetical protein